jgi:hypothetical protein
VIADAEETETDDWLRTSPTETVLAVAEAGNRQHIAAKARARTERKSGLIVRFFKDIDILPPVFFISSIERGYS